METVVTRIMGSKLGCRLERSEGFILGIQVAVRKLGGVRLSLFGWSLFVGAIPVREVTRSSVQCDPLDEMLAAKGKSGMVSIEYRLPNKKESPSNGKA